eukprot:8663390-Alexandrium_andersonii.AAC.1
MSNARVPCKRACVHAHVCQGVSATMHAPVRMLASTGLFMLAYVRVRACRIASCHDCGLQRTGTAFHMQVQRMQ